MIFDDVDLCLSGGAEGADLQWGMCAGQAGHQVIHWGFEGHRSRAPYSEIVKLNREQLAAADHHVDIAHRTLLRKWPVRSTFVANLLRRNYYQICWANALYAVATIDDRNCVNGGTGWAVQMFIDRFDGEECDCFVFDQDEDRWFKWTGYRFDPIDAPPVPSGIWAGVGTRKLAKNGKNAIRSLLGYVKPSAPTVPLSDEEVA